MLAVSGQLDAKLGGPAVRLFGGNRRRAVYGYVDRLEFPSLLTTFDVPNPAGLTPERTSTTVAAAGAVPDERPLRPRCREEAGREASDCKSSPTPASGST